MNKDRDSKLNNLTFYLKTLKKGGGQSKQNPKKKEENKN